MRIGVMLGPERGRYATKVERLRADVRWAEEAGLAAVWIPQIPDDFDALTAAALVGAETSRIEIGTAVVPVQPRHPIALAQQALSTQAVCGGRLALGLGVSHHWVIEDMLGLPYERPVATLRAHLDVLDQALAGPGVVDVHNDDFDVHNPLDITDLTPTPVLIAALGPVMLRLAGERTDGTYLWLADERAIGEHIAPAINAAAEGAGRPAPAWWRGSRSACAPTPRSARRSSGPTASSRRPRPRRTTSACSTAADAWTVGDILAAGSETSIEKRLRAFRRRGGDRRARSGSSRSGRGATSWSPPPSAPAPTWRRSTACWDDSETGFSVSEIAAIIH